MAGSFPTSVTSYTNPPGSTSTATAVGGRTHSQFHSDVCDDLEAVMTKLGTGADTAAANEVLVGTGAGATGFRALLNADVDAAAAIAITKLAHVGANNVLKSNGSANVAGQIVNADVSSSAAITVSKLSAGGVANRAVVTTDGTTLTIAQIVGAMLANSTVDTAQLATNATYQLSFAEGSTSNPTTTSGSFADIPEMTLTQTTTGGVIVAWVSVRSSHSTAGSGSGIALAIDGSALPKSERVHTVSTNGYEFILTTMAVWSGQSAASHTVKARWYTTGGTLTGITDARSIIMLELKK